MNRKVVVIPYEKYEKLIAKQSVEKKDNFSQTEEKSDIETSNPLSEIISKESETDGFKNPNKKVRVLERPLFPPPGIRVKTKKKRTWISL